MKALFPSLIVFALCLASCHTDSSTGEASQHQELAPPAHRFLTPVNGDGLPDFIQWIPTPDTTAIIATGVYLDLSTAREVAFDDYAALPLLRHSTKHWEIQSDTLRCNWGLMAQVLSGRDTLSFFGLDVHKIMKQLKVSDSLSLLFTEDLMLHYPTARDAYDNGCQYFHTVYVQTRDHLYPLQQYDRKGKVLEINQYNHFTITATEIQSDTLRLHWEGKSLDGGKITFQTKLFQVGNQWQAQNTRQEFSY